MDYITIYSAMRTTNQVAAQVYLRRTSDVVGHMAFSHKRGFSCVSSEIGSVSCQSKLPGRINSNFSSYGWISSFSRYSFGETPTIFLKIREK